MNRQQKFREDVLDEFKRIQDGQETRGEKPMELTISQWGLIIGVAVEFAERGWQQGYDERKRQEQPK